MAGSSGGHLDHAGFQAIKDRLTAALAEAFIQKLDSMGEDAKGISWFSSVADVYVAERRRAA